MPPFQITALHVAVQALVLVLVLSLSLISHWLTDMRREVELGRSLQGTFLFPSFDNSFLPRLLQSREMLPLDSNRAYWINWEGSVVKRLGGRL